MSVLKGFKVLELSEGVAGEYCGKLLADFGADVIKLERPGCGSPTRALGPFGPGEPGRENSGLFAYLNTNKASVTLDLSTDAGVATLARLAGCVDVVIDDHAPGWLKAVGIDPTELEDRFPRVVLCAITPYGQAPPGDRRHAEDLNVIHNSGWGYHTPSAPDPERPPLKGPGRFLASYEAGMEAAMCIVSALFWREDSKRGQFIDVSKQAVLASRVDLVIGQFLAGDMEATSNRTAFDLWGPEAIFACREGYAYLWISSEAHWKGLSKLMGDPEWMKDFPPRWMELENTPERCARTRAELGAWMRTQDRNEVAAKAQALGLPMTPVNNAGDLQSSPQYLHRGYFAQVDHPVLGAASYPTVPFKLSVTPALTPGAAPLLGQHTDRSLPALLAMEPGA